MDQTTSIVANATREFLQADLLKKDYRIANLEENLQRVTQRSVTEAAERSNMRNEMHEWTLEALDNAQITESDAEEIASICGFELTKEFELEVTVQYSITVNARSEEDAQNLIHDIDFDSVSEPQGVTYLSSSVDRIEI
jgi:hypothetical protein